MKPIMRSILLLGFIMTATISVSFAFAGHAQVSKKDVQVIAKALGFIENGPQGEINVDVIYDTNDPASIAEADAILDILSSGFRSKIKLKGQKTPVSTGAEVAFITMGAEEKAPGLSQKKIITVSTNPDCAIQGGCVIGVSTYPKIEVHVNTSAMSSAGVSFDMVFRMMVTEH